MAFVFQPGRGRWREVGFALVGLKPLVETWRVLIGAPQSIGHWPSHILLAGSRIVEVLLESLPQAVLQGYVYLQSDAPTVLQRASLLGSLAATGPSRHCIAATAASVSLSCFAII